MTQLNKNNIKAILPLNGNELALLLHRLQSENDEGVIVVKSDLRANLNKEAFIQCWRELFKRHGAFKTKYRWKNIAHPVRVILKEDSPSISFKNWRSLDAITYKTQLEQLISVEKNSGISLEKDQLHRIICIQKSENLYNLIWACHHINLDGWSSAIVLNELITIYDEIIGNKKTILEELTSPAEFYRWTKNQNLNSESFWKDYLNNLPVRKILTPPITSSKSYSGEENIISSELTENLKTTLRKNRLTINTFLQGLWGYVLTKMFNSNDVVYGTVVSGRSVDFPDMDRLVGMFTNILPIRVKMGHQSIGINWLLDLQKENYQMLEYSQDMVSDILYSAREAYKGPLFDTVFILENYPDQLAGNDSIQIENLRSDIVSTFPISIIVIPGEKLEYHIRYNNKIDPLFIKQIMTNIQKIIIGFIATTEFPEIEFKNKRFMLQDSRGTNSERKIINPKNEFEKKLLTIWEKVLNVSPISTDDNFLDIGGSSFTALEIFSRIQSIFQLKLSPNVIVEQNSISHLATKIQLSLSKESSNPVSD